MSSRVLLLLVIAVAVQGCAPLDTAPKRGNKLPSGRLAPDAVVLDVAFLRLRADDLEAYEAIWNAADEQRLAAELRQNLATNGLRVGVFGQQLPAKVQKLLDERPKLLENLSEGANGDLDLGSSRQHLPVRSGHRAVINASKVYPLLPVLLCEEGSVRGNQLTDARCTLSLKAYPQGDGRVKLSITPEIEHGELKMRYGGGEGMMVQQTSQDRLVLDRLRFETMLTPGQSLLISTTPEIKGLGACYFSQQAAGAVDRKLLLVRLAQTQFDDLFNPAQTSAPLATPGE
jgi:hypothetical protein